MRKSQCVQNHPTCLFTQFSVQDDDSDEEPQFLDS